MPEAAIKGVAEYSCATCGKKLKGLLIDNQTEDELILDTKDNGDWDQIGHQCHSCKVIICKECCAQRKMKSWWSGLSKAICPKCQGQFGPPFALISTGELSLSSRKILKTMGYSPERTMESTVHEQEPAQKDTAAVLRELKSLHDAGILSAEEYEEKRKKHLLSL